MKKKTNLSQNHPLINRISYEVDPHNRLISAKETRETGVTKFRTVYDGVFKTSPGNNLIYHIKKSDHKQTPQQIKFSGEWNIDKNHDLTFTLDKWNQECLNNKLTLKGGIKAATGRQLIFELATKDEENNIRSYLLKINGTWQVDNNNQLMFEAENQNGPQKGITLQGAWQVNKFHQIQYAYSKIDSLTKRKIRRVLTLKGQWDIRDRHKISYIIDKKFHSGLDIKISYAKVTPRGLQFDVNFTPGIKKTITLSGQWRISENNGILFQIRPNLLKNDIMFGGFCRLNKNCDLSISLKNKEDENIGLETKISKALLQKQGEAFLKMMASKKEISVTAGIGFKW